MTSRRAATTAPSRFLAIAACGVLSAATVFAQSSGFTYQGYLATGGEPANGTFEFRYQLFDAVSGGNQIGPTVADVALTVVDGVFRTDLDFGDSGGGPPDRFLEIAVRRNSADAYVTIRPRQELPSSSFSVRTIGVGSRDRASAGPASGPPGEPAARAVDTASFRNASTLLRVRDVSTAATRSTAPTGVGVRTDFFGWLRRAAPRQSAGAGQMPRAPLVTGGGISGAMLDLGGIAAPGLSPAGHALVYFDAATNKLKVSENGGPFINLVGAAGVSGSGTTNKLPLWTAANTLSDSAIAQSGTSIGIGTITPTARLAVVGGGFGHNLFVTDSDVTATTFDFQNTSAGTPFWRFQTLGSNVAGRVGNLEIWRSNGNEAALAIQPNGSIGVNTTSPGSGYTLDVFGYLRAYHSTGGNVVSETSGGQNSWAKLWVNTPVQHWSIGSSNSFNGNQLYFANESSGLIRMAIMPSGNVGIGTTDPQTRLEVVETSGFYAVHGLTTAVNSTGVKGEANGGQGIGVWGQSDANTGVFGQTATGTGVWGRSTGSGLALQVEGNAAQSLNNGGLVKAMAYVNGDGTLLRCYNGTTGSSTGNCGGISSSRVGNNPGWYNVDFPFQVDNRFISVTVQSTGGAGVGFDFTGPNSRVFVSVYCSDQSVCFTDRPVMVLVY